VAVAIVDDLEQKRDQIHFGSLDDVTLVETMMGLNAEVAGAPEWGTTPKARYIRRMLFTEIADRWIPADVFASAFDRVIEGSVDA
jgi:hypothetical protein